MSWDNTNNTLILGTKRPVKRFHRGLAVRIVLPGIDDDEHRTTQEESYAYDDLLTEVIDNHSNIREIETLVFPGRQQQEHIFAVKVTEATSTQTTLDEDQFQSSPQQAAVEFLAGKMAEYFPEYVGVETVHVNLSTVGVTPIRTGRLVLPENREPVGANLAYNPARWATRELRKTELPFFLQLLVRSSRNNKYQLTVRLCVVDLPEMSSAETNLTDLIENDPKHDPAELFKDTGLTSNFQMPIEDHYESGHLSYQLDPAKYMDPSDSRKVKEITNGKNEYVDLLNGRSGGDSIYSDTIGYPRMPVTDVQLRNFAVAVAYYYETSPWTSIKGRRAPIINTKEVVRAAPGTEHGHGTETNELPEEYYTEPATKGSKDHELRLQNSIQFYKEQGISAERQEQKGSSVPDGIVYPEEEPRALESVRKSLSKPAKPLVNVIRAKEQELAGVTFVTKDQSDANRLHKILKEPYKQKTSTGVITYNVDGQIAVDTDTTVLLPSDAGQAMWHLTNAGRLQLQTDNSDRVLAEGDAETPLEELEYQCPRYEEADGTYTVLAATGETISTYETKKKLLEDWTQVNPPLVPTKHHYLTDTEIIYQHKDTFKQYKKTPEWQQSAEGVREVREGAMEEFLDRYIIEPDAEEVRKKRVFKKFEEFYFGLVDDETESDGDGSSLPKNEIGRALPEKDVSRRTVDGEKVPFLQNWCFVYPEGLQSPALPVDDT